MERPRRSCPKASTDGVRGVQGAHLRACQHSRVRVQLFTTWHQREGSLVDAHRRGLWRRMASADSRGARLCVGGVRGTRGAWRKVSLSERPSDTPVADRGAVAWHCQPSALQLTGCGARSGVLMPARLPVRLRRLGMRARAPARLPLAPQASVRPTAQLRLRRPSQPSERRAFCRPTAQLRLKRPSQPSVASRGARSHAAFPSTELEHPLRGRARDRP